VEQETKPDEGVVRSTAGDPTTFAVDQPDPDAEWRLELSPVLQPIAQRYGRLLFCYCYNVGMTNEALGILAQATQRAVMTLQGANARKTAAEVGMNSGNAAKALHNVLGWFSATLVEQTKWTPAEIQECSTDIARGLQLAMSTPNQDGGEKKIILAH